MTTQQDAPEQDTTPANPAICAWEGDQQAVLIFESKDWYGAPNGISSVLAMQREKARLDRMGRHTSMTYFLGRDMSYSDYILIVSADSHIAYNGRPATGTFYRVTPQNCHPSIIQPVKSRKKG